jgi:Fe(3+) dicitrate transport protein
MLKAIVLATTVLPALVFPEVVEAQISSFVSKEPFDTASIDRVSDVIVIGERQNLLTIPGSGATIEAEDLERSRPLTINDALRQIPGVFPRDEEGMGLRPNIGILGLNPTRSTKVLLLEDGIPLA